MAVIKLRTGILFPVGEFLPRISTRVIFLNNNNVVKDVDKFDTYGYNYFVNSISYLEKVTNLSIL